MQFFTYETACKFAQILTYTIIPDDTVGIAMITEEKYRQYEY